MKPNCRSLVSVLALLSLTLLGPKNSAASPITVGYPQLSGGSMPLLGIAQSKLDQRDGGDVKTIFNPRGAILPPSPTSRGVGIALTGGAVVGAILGGADLTYVGIGLSTYGFTVYAKPEIRDINDFRGKVFGVITKGASSDHAAIAVFKRYGIRYGQDVKILYFARQGDLLASLQKGIVSGGVFSSPTTVMSKRLGFKTLVDIASFK